MKKIFILLALVLFVFAANAQKIGKIQTFTVDTVKGDENIYLTPPNFTGSYDYVTQEVVFTKISTAAGGTAYFQGSVNGSTYQTLTSTDDLFIFFPNDTVTVTEAGSMNVIIKGNPYNKYRWFIDGDANDTVIIAPYALIK